MQGRWLTYIGECLGLKCQKCRCPANGGPADVAGGLCDPSKVRETSTSTPMQEPTSQVQCPPVPIWDRHVGPGNELEMAASPEGAVSDFSALMGASVSISSSQPGASEDEATVLIIDNATDEPGSYLVVRESGGWSVNGGEGCGASGPPVPICPNA